MSPSRLLRLLVAVGLTAIVLYTAHPSEVLAAAVRLRLAMDRRRGRPRAAGPRPHGAAVDRPAQRPDAGIAPALFCRPADLFRQLVRQQLRAERSGRHVPRLCARTARRAPRRVHSFGTDGPHPRRAVDGAGGSRGAAVRLRERGPARSGARPEPGVRRVRGGCRVGLQRNGCRCRATHQRDDPDRRACGTLRSRSRTRCGGTPAITES